MTRDEHMSLLSEKAALARMLAETPEEDAFDRASLEARLKKVEEALLRTAGEAREPARVRLTFQGRPVVGSHGIFAEFGMKAVAGFTESVAAMAASLTAPLASAGPIPNRAQHQLLITSTALGSFGFELEELSSGQQQLTGDSPVAEAIARTQALLRGTQGTDDELADSVADADGRVRDKVRAFLEVLADHEAVCAVRYGDSVVRFRDVGEVRRCVERLRQENIQEQREELRGALQGVLPTSRQFEFKPADGGVLRGKISPSLGEPDALNRLLNLPVAIDVMSTRVGSGRPRYVLLGVRSTA